MRLAPLVAALVVVLAGCAADVPRNSEGRVTVEATTDAFSIAVGDCVGKVDGDSADELPLVPCTEAHFWEAYAASDLAGDAFPGNAGVKDLADKACADAFEGFIGVAPDDSKYEVTYLTPTKETWTQAQDREVVCMVGSSKGNITASLKDAGK